MLLLENNSIFWGLVLWLVWHICSSLGLIISYHWAKPFEYSVSLCKTLELWFLSVWLGKDATLSAPGECWTLFSNLFRPFPPGLQGFFTWTHQPVLSEYQRGTLCSSLGYSVYTAPPLCCLVLPTPPHLASWLPASSPSPRSSLPAPNPGNCAKTASWSNHKAYLTCFLSLRDHYLLLSTVLKTVVFYILSVSFCLFILGRRVNSIPTSLSWAKVESSRHLLLTTDFWCLGFAEHLTAEGG